MVIRHVADGAVYVGAVVGVGFHLIFLVGVAPLALGIGLVGGGVAHGLAVAVQDGLAHIGEHLRAVVHEVDHAGGDQSHSALDGVSAFHSAAQGVEAHAAFFQSREVGLAPDDVEVHLLVAHDRPDAAGQVDGLIQIEELGQFGEQLEVGLIGLEHSGDDDIPGGSRVHQGRVTGGVGELRVITVGLPVVEDLAFGDLGIDDDGAAGLDLHRRDLASLVQRAVHHGDQIGFHIIGGDGGVRAGHGEGGGLALRVIEDDGGVAAAPAVEHLVLRGLVGHHGDLAAGVDLIGPVGSSSGVLHGAVHHSEGHLLAFHDLELTGDGFAGEGALEGDGHGAGAGRAVVGVGHAIVHAPDEAHAVGGGDHGIGAHILAHIGVVVLQLHVESGGVHLGGLGDPDLGGGAEGVVRVAVGAAGVDQDGLGSGDLGEGGGLPLGVPLPAAVGHQGPVAAVGIAGQLADGLVADIDGVVAEGAVDAGVAVLAGQIADAVDGGGLSQLHHEPQAAQRLGGAVGPVGVPDGASVVVYHGVGTLTRIVVLHLGAAEHGVGQLGALAGQRDIVGKGLAVVVLGADGDGAVLVEGHVKVGGALHGDALLGDALVGGHAVRGAVGAVHVEVAHRIAVDGDAGDGIRRGGHAEALVALFHQLGGVIGLDGGDAVGVAVALIGGEAVAVQGPVAHEGGVGSAMLVQVDAPDDLRTVGHVDDVPVGGAVVAAGVHLLGGVVEGGHLDLALGAHQQAGALVIGEGGPAHAGVVAVLLGPDHLLGHPVGILAHGILIVVHLLGIHAHHGAAVPVHIGLLGTAAVVGQVVILLRDLHAGAHLGQTAGGEVAGGDELVQDHDLAVAVDVIAHEAAGVHSQVAAHGHEDLGAVLALGDGDGHVGHVLIGAGILQLGDPRHGGVIVGLGAVVALLGAGGHDHIAVELIADDGALLGVQGDLEGLAVVGSAGQDHLIADGLDVLKGDGGLLQGQRRLLLEGELELLVGDLIARAGPRLVLGALHSEGEQVVAALLGLEVIRDIQGDGLHVLPVQGLAVHMGGGELQGPIGQLGEAVLREGPLDVEGAQVGILILVDHPDIDGAAGGHVQIVGIEVHLLVDLLGLVHLGAGGAVGEHHAVAAEGVVIAVGVDPVAAVAPELLPVAVLVDADGADGVVDELPDEATVGVVLLPDHFPVLLGVAVGLSHRVVVLRVDMGHQAVISRHVGRQPILGGVHVHDVVLPGVDAPGVGALGLGVVVAVVAVALALVLAQAAGIPLEQVHRGHPETVVVVEGVLAVGGLVAQGPHDDGCVVLVPLQVGGHTVQYSGHPLGQALTGAAGHLDAVGCGGVALDVGLGADVEAQLVGQIVQDLIVRVVRGTHRVQVVLLHQGQVGVIVLIVEGVAGLGVGVVAVDAPEDHLAAVDLHLLVSGVVDVHLIDLAEAHPLHYGLHDLAAAVLQLQH